MRLCIYTRHVEFEAGLLIKIQQYRADLPEEQFLKNKLAQNKGLFHFPLKNQKMLGNIFLIVLTPKRCNTYKSVLKVCEMNRKTFQGLGRSRIQLSIQDVSRLDVAGTRERLEESLFRLYLIFPRRDGEYFKIVQFVHMRPRTRTIGIIMMTYYDETSQTSTFNIRNVTLDKLTQRKC